ncbi:Methyltransferase domain-containing protein [Bosea sp. 62]|nr:Methyltransferase domain-containing protein [Bosea sp. 21B]CAD5288153.1 Methyltransferase domain-containing protein [Bosea sp. 46]CAD5301480.1 Methyltransferase domain-containing protein [Bosea sp. 7B]VVT51091.1 Methyltransferase domain-containing protein [Bosea sp. EC-HK365B]VXB08903.1 Methyltransferase domain-containing protein [Bosea sp. 62]VXB70194.1 Methyltransferase domain-containing protein [Bosea sp. 127]VXC57749.1 Methyltransferase domain-containing protein [Bosea sp. 29B]VXC9106
MPSNKIIPFRCPHPECGNLQETADRTGLVCDRGHVYSYAPGTKIPVFADAPAGSSEYSIVDAAEVHDNALRWLFATFCTDEDTLRENLISRLGLVSGQSLLVTGAGAGNDLPYIAKKMEGRGTIHAQDIASQMLLAGASRHSDALSAIGIDIRFSVCDATQLPYGDRVFDAAYHYGGINLFSSIGQGIAEMNRVVKPGGKIVISDEGLAPWLLNSEIGKQLVANNQLYACQAPIALLPETARDVKLSFELHNCFYVIEFSVGDGPLPINIDVPHVGRRGGSIRKRYAGRLEGIDPALKEAVYAEAERVGESRVDFLEKALRAALRT